MKVELHEHERSERPRCPICHDDLAGDEWACPKCGTRHHAECAKEHGRCAELGCEGLWGPPARVVDPVTEADEDYSFVRDRLQLVGAGLFFFVAAVATVAIVMGLGEVFGDRLTAGELTALTAVSIFVVVAGPAGLVIWWRSRSDRDDEDD